MIDFGCKQLIASSLIITQISIIYSILSRVVSDQSFLKSLYRHTSSIFDETWAAKCIGLLPLTSVTEGSAPIASNLSTRSTLLFWMAIRSGYKPSGWETTLSSLKHMDQIRFEIEMGTFSASPRPLFVSPRSRKYFPSERLCEQLAIEDEALSHPTVNEFLWRRSRLNKIMKYVIKLG